MRFAWIAPALAGWLAGCAAAPAAPSAPAPSDPAPETAAPAPAYAQPRLFAYNFGTGPDGGPWLMTVADLDGDGFGDPVAVYREDPGSVHLLQNVRGGKCAALGEVAKGTGAAESLSVRREASGRDVVVVTQRGGAPARVLFRAADGSFGVREDDAAAALAVAPPGGVPPPDAQSARTPPALDLPEGAVTASGDVTGDGVADLLIFRRDSAWRVGWDVELRAGLAPGAADSDQDGATDAEEAQHGSDPLDGDTDRDGLLDGWEIHGEGGIDMPGLGASPVRQDCFVYLQCIGEVDDAGTAAEIDRAVQTWAALPNVNRDGSTGIRLHPLWLPHLGPEAGAKAWWTNADENMPKRAKGLAHYIQIAPGGGGQSSELGDAGGCGANALWATFLHEFGHQVGLSHSGGALPGMCPIYTSLMNYAYSYGFEDDYWKIHYSTGALQDLELNETALHERLDIAYARLAFLARGPYSFKVQEDGTGTLIDWNRNGSFETEPVRADITDVYGADGGIRHHVAKTIVGASIVNHRGQLWIFSVNREKVLEARSALETEGQFSEPIALTQVAATGDLWATSDGERLTLFVPTAEGVAVLAAAAAADLAAAAPVLIPDTAGAHVSGFVHGGRTRALLWSALDQPVRISEPGADGAWRTPQPFAELKSSMAPSGVADPASGELVVGYGTETVSDAGTARNWRVARYLPADGGWTQQSERIVGGAAAGWYGNSRPVLLIESEPTDPAPGRLHFIARGFVDPADANCCWFEAITIGDASQADGWRLRRWYDEWTTTKSPVGAAFYQGDLALSYRWFGNVHGDDDESLQVAFHGFSVHDQILRDFDDVSEISNFGLARSIPWRHPVEN